MLTEPSVSGDARHGSGNDSLLSLVAHISFRFREVEKLRRGISVGIEGDEHGFLGRECPVESCELYFKIKPGTGLSGEDLPCICPYCGHKARSDHFFTKEQIEYAKSVAFRQISDAFGRDLKQLEQKPSRGSLIGLTVKLKAGHRPPIAHYREQELETHLTCSACTLQYAVFGLFGFCPDCGLHNSRDILKANLALVEKQIALALAQDDLALRRHLLEDALENCVSAFDGFGRETVRAAQRAVGGAPPSFQNLQRASVKLQQLFAIDMRGAVSADKWAAAQRSFMKRHLLSHRSGVVDEQYLEETADPDARLGHRVTISKEEIQQTLTTVAELGDWLAAQIAAKAG